VLVRSAAGTIQVHSACRKHIALIWRALLRRLLRRPAFLLSECHLPSCRRTEGKRRVSLTLHLFIRPILRQTAPSPFRSSRRGRSRIRRAPQPWHIPHVFQFFQHLLPRAGPSARLPVIPVQEWNLFRTRTRQMCGPAPGANTYPDQRERRTHPRGLLFATHFGNCVACPRIWFRNPSGGAR
jgi:hypothetical protein